MSAKSNISKGGKMKEFNVVVSGIGGQGVLTIADAIVEAAMKNGYDVKGSELHGLAMRFGHLESHIRFGKEIHSSIVEEAGADLIIALERLEALRALYYANKKTIIIFDSTAAVPVQLHLDKIKYPEVEEVVKNLKKYSKKVFYINAAKAAKELTGKTVFSNVYTLGYAFAKGHIPLKKESLLYGIKQLVPPDTFGINKKVFEIAISRKR
jgi:indolepyruvate ferredoxin oxidoreductase beta subunit